MALLREGLLDGCVLAVSGLSEELGGRLRELGAQLQALEDAAVLGADEERVGEWARAHVPLHALVCDVRPQFGGGGSDGLVRAHERAWTATREVAVGALIPGEDPGRVILIAPPPDAGAFAEAARAGLENLVRTLSVEWARFAITTVAVAPGIRAREDQLGDLLGFLCSPAGGYFSGCRIDLGASR